MTEHELSQFTGADCYGPCCGPIHAAYAEAEYFASVDALTAEQLDAMAADDFARADRRRADEFAPCPF